MSVNMFSKGPFDRLKRWRVKKTNKLFVRFLILRSRLFPKPELKILFSNREDWQKDIKNGFRYTNHEVTFGDLSTKDIKAYDLVVPLTIPALKYAAEKRGYISNKLIPIPCMESILLCDDKYLLNKKLAANGFQNFIPKMGKQTSYPYILKKSKDEWGEHSYIIADSQQEKKFSTALKSSDYFSQDFVKGSNEYATHIIFKDQKIAWSLNIKYWFNTNTPVKGKDKKELLEICRCPYLKLFASMLTFIGFEGICCINYKVRNNQPLLLEINPRFGGSLSPYFFSAC